MDPQETFNIYCDESRVENPDSQYMVIGALFFRREEKARIGEALKALLKKHKFEGELKWIKTNSELMPLYREFIDYFVNEKELFFRCVIVDKNKIEYQQHHNNDAELAFFKFYYLMLKGIFESNKRYYISLDRKPTRDKNRARALLSVINSYLLFNKWNCKIEHFQAYDSRENIFIQFADYFTGLVGEACNKKDKSKQAKKEIVEYLAKKLEREDICNSTPRSEQKFNVFVWRPAK